MQWSAIDYMVRLDRKQNDVDYVASGDSINTETAREQWTFSRIQGGRWLLSAIQQLG
jgi:predicted lipid-binding transport protein (Tim44 family)